jgi:signal transduction histidine kinase
VLLNLLTNACKHTERGSVTLSMDTVSMESVEAAPVGGEQSGASSDAAGSSAGNAASSASSSASGGVSGGASGGASGGGGEVVDGAGSLRICFSVADTGPGVPAHVREKIFHEFEQGHVSKVHAGTGLGLALCRDMVSAMGGSIRLECPPDGGSQFSFELTMAIAPTEPEGEARWVVGACSGSPPTRRKMPHPQCATPRAAVPSRSCGSALLIQMVCSGGVGADDGTTARGSAYPTRG